LSLEDKLFFRAEAAVKIWVNQSEITHERLAEKSVIGMDYEERHFTPERVITETSSVFTFRLPANILSGPWEQLYGKRQM
jgi:hypothetical protein